MNKKLIANEFKSSLRTFIIWSFIILIFVSTTIILFPLYKNNYDIISAKIEKLPNILLKILSIDLTTLSTLNGYYAFIIEYTLILGAIMASILSFKAILWDTINGYNNYLFTKPISRKKIFINKIIVLVLELLIFNIIFNIISIILLKIFNSDTTFSVIKLIQINSALLLSQFTFAALAMMISSFIKKPKRIYPIALLIILVFYIVSIIEKLINFKLIRYINPFSYFKISDIVLNGTYKYSFIIASLFIIVFSISISYREYDLLEIEK
ncbi:MAG: ABC transporter permease subunit [Anaeroplasmataceae bacterium]